MKHMKSLKIVLPLALCSVIILSAWYESDKGKDNDTSNARILYVNPKEMKHIGNVDERYQSYNVEMVEVVGGRFWKPYRFMDSLPSSKDTSTHDISQNNDQIYRKLPAINLADKRLLNLAKGLAPAYVRVSGTWANATYFQDNDEPKMANPPAGFVNVLTREQWKGVVDFLKSTNSKLVTSFAVSNGVRDSKGVWTPIEAQKIVNYTKSLGGDIAAAELFNEPTIPDIGGEMDKNYNSINFAKDISRFTSWARKDMPICYYLVREL